jgi:hypothetical protein
VKGDKLMQDDLSLMRERHVAIMRCVREEVRRELKDLARQREFANSGTGFDRRIGPQTAVRLLIKTVDTCLGGEHPRNKRALAKALRVNDRQLAALFSLPSGPALGEAGPLQRVMARVIARIVTEFAPGPPEALVVSSPNAAASAPSGDVWGRAFGMTPGGPNGAGTQRLIAVYLSASQARYGYSVSVMAAVAPAQDDGLAEARAVGRELAVAAPASYAARLIEHASTQVDTALGRVLPIIVLQGRKDALATRTSASTLDEHRDSLLVDPGWSRALAPLSSGRPVLVEAADCGDRDAAGLDPNFEFHPHDAPGVVVSASEFERQLREPRAGDPLMTCWDWVGNHVYEGEDEECQAITYEGVLVDRRTGASSRVVVIGNFDRMVIFAIPFGPDGQDRFPNLGRDGGHPEAEAAIATARRIHIDDVVGGDYVGTCRRNIGLADEYLRIPGREPNVRENALSIGTALRLGELRFPGAEPDGTPALV